MHDETFLLSSRRKIPITDRKYMLDLRSKIGTRGRFQILGRDTRSLPVPIATPPPVRVTPPVRVIQPAATETAGSFCHGGGENGAS